MLKIIRIVILAVIVFLVLIVVGLVYLSKKPSSPKEYWSKIATDSTIESRYNELGKYSVTYKSFDAPKDDRDQTDNHFVVWYPEKEGTYPLLIMVNGTGVPCQKYESVFKNFASWGYVVVGNDYGTNWDGKHASETLDFALNTEEIANMIDKDKIAIGGHSQGGMGTFNAITEYDNGNMYKVAFSLSPTNAELGIALKWGFDLDTNNQYAFRLNKINIPMMIIAGTGKFDSKTVSPLSKMEEEYEQLSSDKVMFRRSDNVDHGNMLYEANGYVIAWLDYYLKDNKDNEKAFYGDNPEIENNPRYQDFTSQKNN